MQLRTVKKPKSKAFDYNKESQPDIITARRSSVSKEQEIAAESGDSVAVRKVLNLTRILNQMSLKKMSRRVDTN
jgi:hypothetical protein